MSKDKLQLLSPLFLKYQADYEKNPRSRVFAPLAETYRKLGMNDKAMEILAQGIRFHPTYVMGYLGLAFCYFDLKQFTLAYNTLRPLIDNNRDNLRLQKLFADTCIELNYKEEALETFKYLLFINPRDKEVATQVATLEKLIEEQYKPTHQPIYIPESEFKNESKESEHKLFDIDKLDTKPLANKADFDDWMALDLSRDQHKTPTEDPYEKWSVKKGDTPVNLSEERPAQVTPAPVPVEDKIHLHLDDDDESELADDAEIPVVTHTLVDLYCGQGHIEKALEVLEKILILNPADQKTIKKIQEIKALMGPLEHEASMIESIVKPETQKKDLFIPHNRPNLEVLADTSEEDGRKNLMNILDQQLGNLDAAHLKTPEKKQEEKKPKATKKPSQDALENQRKLHLEEKLNQFLKKIQKRALDYQARI
jgi:tetratricopeptide (TPR) repeat protein